jgi:hypothetical protein
MLATVPSGSFASGGVRCSLGPPRTSRVPYTGLEGNHRGAGPPRTSRVPYTGLEGNHRGAGP